MKRWRWILGVAVIGLVAYAASRVDWRSAAHVLARASLPFLAAGVAANGGSLVLRGIRWWIFLRPVGARSVALAIRGAIVGSGFNNFLVANGGDAARAVFVARATGVSVSSVLATLALDRAFDPLCFVLLLFAATFAVALPPAFANARVGAGVVLVAAAIALLALLRAPRLGRAGVAVAGWRAHLRRFSLQVRSLVTAPRVAIALLCSMAVWLLQLIEYAMVANALDIGLPFTGSVAAMLLINAGLVLRATPAGLGYFQFAYAIAVSRFGVATDAAVATALLIQVVEIVPVTAAALAFSTRGLPTRRAGSEVDRSGPPWPESTFM